MSDAQAQLEGLRTGWELCKSQDDQKHSLISNLFAYIEKLSGELSEAESELRDKKDVVKLTRDRVEAGERKIQALESEKARHVFASVLVDGDSMPFRDELVVQGLEGGKRAASLLKRAAKEELNSSMPGTAHHLEVIVRVYTNVKGLAKTYKELDLVSENTFFEFVRGFNMGDSMCDYTDAGNGKECADEKVKGNVHFYLANVHCQQILFGGTADNGYARLLGPYAQDDTTRERITLLEGPPFGHELAAIKDRFRNASFQDVFRSQKLLDSNKRRVSFHLTPPATPAQADYASAVARPSSPAAAAAPAPKLPSSALARSTAPASSSKQLVARNQSGQRVDLPLTYSQQDFVTLKGRKLCNSFHLLGKCYFLDRYGHCQHEHGDKLNTNQTAALRAVARQSVCQYELDCDDPDCIAGHRCTRGDACVVATCRFPPSMHKIDTVIVG